MVDPTNLFISILHRNVVEVAVVPSATCISQQTSCWFWAWARVFQVGDPASDHSCWERPEDMDTPRTAYKINAQNPGSDVAAETAAALAAASMVFQTTDMPYSARLLTAARQVLLNFKITILQCEARRWDDTKKQ